jgi:hypothetical protein
VGRTATPGEHHQCDDRQHRDDDSANHQLAPVVGFDDVGFDDVGFDDVGFDVFGFDDVEDTAGADAPLVAAAPVGGLA